MSTSKWTFDDIPDQSGKIIIVTGGNSGLGYESVKAFALKGASVVLACRNTQKGEDAKAKILAFEPSGDIHVMKIDLNDLQSVRSFADEFKTKFSQLDVLMNNAGIMSSPNFKTIDGFETHFGINHLGHFALTGLLFDSLKNTPKSRIVNVASLAHRSAEMDLNDLMYEHRKFKQFKAYAQSKLANLLFTYELRKRLEINNINCIAVAAHPGGSNTRLANHLEKKWYYKILSPLARGVLQSAAKGALSQLRAAVDPEVKGGEYYGPDRFNELFGSPVLVQPTSAAKDQELASKLWVISEKLTKVSFLEDKL